MVHRFHRSILLLLRIMDSRNPLLNPDQACTYGCWIDCSTRADELRSQLHGFVNHWACQPQACGIRGVVNRGGEQQGTILYLMLAHACVYPSGEGAVQTEQPGSCCWAGKGLSGSWSDRNLLKLPGIHTKKILGCGKYCCNGAAAWLLQRMGKKFQKRPKQERREGKLIGANQAPNVPLISNTGGRLHWLQAQASH